MTPETLQEPLKIKNKNVKGVLIKEHMLDADLRKKINDSLSILELLADTVGKNFAQDTEMASKLVSLENATSELKEKLKGLDSQLTVTAGEAVKVDDKLDKADAESTYRKLKNPIKTEDISEDLKALLHQYSDMFVRLNDIYSNYINNDILKTNAELESRLDRLETEKASKNHLNSLNFADKDSVENCKNRITTLEKQLKVLGAISERNIDYNALSAYRKTTDKLRIEDFETELKKSLEIAVSAGKSVDDTCRSISKEAFQNYDKMQLFDIYGHPDYDVIHGGSEGQNDYTDAAKTKKNSAVDKANQFYPYTFAKAITQYMGTFTSSGKMTFTGAMNLLWERLNETNAWVKRVEDNSTSKFSSIFGSGSKKGYETRISALEDDMKDLQDKVDILISDVENMKKKIK